jgi:hypothetical protein
MSLLARTELQHCPVQVNRRKKCSIWAWRSDDIREAGAKLAPDIGEGRRMSNHTQIDSVQQDMFAVLHGQETPLLTRWSYRSDDPFAVMMSIARPSGRWIDWLMGRDLVVDGMDGPAGIGDVQLTPFTDDEFDVLEVKIGDDEGFASLEFDRDLIERFLDATYDIVALGTESTLIDVEAEIEKITTSWAG